MSAQLKLVDCEAQAPDLGNAATPDSAVARKSLLRFITCGSVDDGKSTLLGRLLFETGAVFEDQIEALERDSARFGTIGGEPDFALLVDGLAAEREQGITIDVAYRYFATKERAFIAADTPGHEQYTRNMATGASTADVAIILVDARKGLLPQTRRHSYIVSMLGVRRVIVAVNKIDLVGYDEKIFRAIERDYRALAGQLDFVETHIIPVSARHGDNVVERSDKIPWSAGPSLLTLLETIEAMPAQDDLFRFPVQWVNRPDLDFRGFSGTVASGAIAVGDAITALPRGKASRIARILGPSGDQDEASAGKSVTLVLTDEIDVSRGDVIVATQAPIKPQRAVSARILAMHEAPIAPGRTYLVKIGATLATARLVALHHQVDVHDYVEKPADQLEMNGIGRAMLRFETDVVVAGYGECQALGGLLLIDPHTHETLALGVVEAHEESARERIGVGRRIAALLARAKLVPVAARGEVATPDLAWLGASALLTALLALALTGAPLIALAVGLADAVLRPALRSAADELWWRIGARRSEQAASAMTADSGGI